MLRHIIDSYNLIPIGKIWKTPNASNICQGIRVSNVYTHEIHDRNGYGMSKSDFFNLIDYCYEHNYKAWGLYSVWKSLCNQYDSKFTDIEFSQNKYSFKATTNGYPAFIDVYDEYSLYNTNHTIILDDDGYYIPYQYDFQSNSFQFWVEKIHIKNNTYKIFNDISVLNKNSFKFCLPGENRTEIVSLNIPFDWNNIKIEDLTTGKIIEEGEVIFKAEAGHIYKIYSC